MRSLVVEFSHLWPQDRMKLLMPLLNKVKFVYFPDDRHLFGKIRSPHQVVVVVRSAELADIGNLVSYGFEHFIQLERPDFGSELLAAALMVVRPAAFAKNPIPFFFNGFQKATKDSIFEPHFTVQFKKSSDKSYLIDRMALFFKQSKKLSAVSELCVHAAEEMISNALFHAPVRASGERLYENLDRRLGVIVPDEKHCNLFVGASDYRVIVGVEDQFGSLKKHLMLEHVERVFSKRQMTPSQSRTGGGLGLRFMLESSANFYLLVEAEKRTLVACGFLLAGMRKNTSQDKHVHIAFR
jgi:hypothetical protein